MRPLLPRDLWIAIQNGRLVVFGPRCLRFAQGGVIDRVFAGVVQR